MLTSPSNPPNRKAVAFNLDPTILPAEKSNNIWARNNRIMAKQLYESSRENYGIWGKDAAKLGPFAQPGSRVRLSKDRLRGQYLPDGATCSYVRVTVDGHLAGNAFACRWISNGKIEVDDDIYGLMSSHPAACMAAAKVFGNSINLVNIDCIRKYAEAVMKVSPISYVKGAKLCGSLFDPGDTSGRISSVDTNFFVDHAESLEALAWVRQEREWPLGELLEGIEFVIILEVRRRA
ncbi:hypothetical protein V1504DRAFT_472055 [Lipomyces starkeyi]